MLDDSDPSIRAAFGPVADVRKTALPPNIYQTGAAARVVSRLDRSKTAMPVLVTATSVLPSPVVSAAIEERGIPSQVRATNQHIAVDIN